MKLLDIAQSYISDSSTDIGGIFIHRQFLALKKRGWDIRVINPQPILYRELKGIGGDYPRISIHDGISIWRPRFYWIPHLVQNAGLILEHSYASAVAGVIPELTINCQPDLVVGDWLVPGGLGAAQTAKRFNIPLVLRARGHDVPIIVNSSRTSRRHKSYYRKILETATRIICQGQGLHKEMEQSGLFVDLFDEQKIVAMTNGIDTDLFYPPSPEERSRLRDTLGFPPEAQVWFFAGRWEEAKGSREFAAALRNLLPRFPHIHFMAAGPLRDVQTSQALVGLSNRVRFLGSQPPDRVAELLRASDVYILPSYREGLPNSVLEAMASGLVTIATPVGGIPYVIKNDQNGILIEAHSAIALEEALARCAENLSALRPLGQAACRTIFEKHYDLAAVAESVHYLFSSLVNIHEITKDF